MGCLCPRRTMGHREAEGTVGILDGLVLVLLLLALFLSFALEDPSVPLPLALAFFFALGTYAKLRFEEIAKKEKGES